MSPGRRRACGHEITCNTSGLLSQVASGGHAVAYARTLVSGQQLLTLTRTTTQSGFSTFTSQIKVDPVLGPLSVVHASPITATYPLQSRVRTGLRIDYWESTSRSYWQYAMDDRGQITDTQKHVYTSLRDVFGFRV